VSGRDRQGWFLEFTLRVSVTSDLCVNQDLHSSKKLERNPFGRKPADMKSFPVLLTDLPWRHSHIAREGLAATAAEAIEAPVGDEPTLVRLAAGVDAIATCWA